MWKGEGVARVLCRKDTVLAEFAKQDGDDLMNGRGTCSIISIPDVILSNV